VQHPARPELREIFRILRVVRKLRLLLGVEVVEIAEELVEAVGSVSLRSPTWFLPNWPVAYPRFFMIPPMVGSSWLSPMGAPGKPTLVSPVRVPHRVPSLDPRPIRRAGTRACAGTSR